MSPFRLPLAIIGFLGLVAVVPVWVFLVSNYTGSLTLEGQFLAGLTLPATVALFIAGWLQPR